MIDDATAAALNEFGQSIGELGGQILDLGENPAVIELYGPLAELAGTTAIFVVCLIASSAPAMAAYADGPSESCCGERSGQSNQSASLDSLSLILVAVLKTLTQAVKSLTELLRSAAPYIIFFMPFIVPMVILLTDALDNAC